MKLVVQGSVVRVFGDDLTVKDTLDARTYKVRFDSGSGFFLEQARDFVSTEKMYGSHEGKILKVMGALEKMPRSLGVIMSGDKGIGKSLFARALATSAIEKGLPVIIVDEAYPGISDFIDSIEQEVMVLFDEFEKVFRETGDQNKLLSLFDGVSQTKRLYVLTVNDLNRVSSYLLNRTGRLHYHLRFGYPSGEDVIEYLSDKVDSKYKSEITAVSKFAKLTNINYDNLRAIAFELNMGTSLKDALTDLNILSLQTDTWEATITMSDGNVDTDTVRTDMAVPSDVSFYVHDPKEYMNDRVTFNTGNVVTDSKGGLTVLVENTKLEYDDDRDDEENKGKERPTVKSVTLAKQGARALHYKL